MPAARAAAEVEPFSARPRPVAGPGGDAAAGRTVDYERTFAHTTPSSIGGPMFGALAYVLVQPGKPLVRERRVFAGPAPSQAVIQVLGCGLCHTDLGYARGEVPTRKSPPLILGHEVVGRVVAAGEGVTSVRAGDVVLVPAVMPCGNCVFCSSGRGNAC